VEDYFPEAAAKFTDGMSPAKKAQTLVQHCLQNELLGKLLGLVEKNYPAKYQEYQAALFLPGEPGEPTPPATPATDPSPPAQPETTATVPPADPPADPAADDRPNVFISYSRRDLAFVTLLHQELIKHGVSAWFDKENIEVGNQWAMAIVEGIRDCKVFLLVLSPDSAASANVRKEVDLAQRYGKQIVPLIWRTTEIPIAMEYQLAGIQWMEFKEDASPAKFNDLAQVMQRLIGGAGLTQATSNSAIAKASTIPVVAKEEPAPAQTGPRQIGGLKKKLTFSPVAVGGAVISGVVTTFGLETSDQDFVNAELKWLFLATDNFFKIRHVEVNRNQAISTPIPPDAQCQPNANNQLLSTVDDYSIGLWGGRMEGLFKLINTYLKNLDILLEQEALYGEDLHRENKMKIARTSIVKILQELAQLMNEAYGVKVTSPDQLFQLLQ
jgi:hypothetical protein